MTHAPSAGVLILDTDLSVRQVDDTALSLLDVDRTTLLDDTPPVLYEPVSDTEGSTYPSLREYLRSLLERGEASAPSIVLPNEIRATVRVTYDANGPNGLVLLCQHGSSAEETASAFSPEPDPSHNERLLQAQKSLLEAIAQGASLTDVLTDLISFIEAERPGMVGSVLLLNPDTRTLHHGSAPSLPPSYVEAIDGLSIGPRSGSCGTAAHRGEPVIATDIETNDHWADFRSVALAHNLRACWSTPIFGEEDEILGTFALYYDEPRAPTEYDRSLIAEASRLASIAIEYDRHKQALRLQKEQFQRLVENAQPIVFLLDAEGTILLSEGEDLSAVNLGPGEIVGESIYDLYEGHPTLLEYIDRALDGETVDATVEIEGVLFDIWYSPYYDRNEKVAGCIGMAVDITERRDAERALRANRDLLRRTQEMAHVGGWEYDPQTDAMVGTEETYRIYGLPQDAELTLEQSLTFYPPEIASNLKAAAQHCLTHGAPFDLEAPLTTDAGTERWVRIRGEAQRNDDGTIIKMVGTVQDLTERHEMEVELRKQKEWLQSITENVSGGIYRSTEDEGLVYANQAFLDLFGYDSLQDILEAPVQSLYAHPNVRQELTRRENEQGGLNGIEVEYRRKDGSTFIGLLRSTQVTDDAGEPRYYDGVITDITEQKIRERKFREQRRKIEAMYESSGRLLQASSRKEVASLLTTLLTDTFGYPGVVVRGIEDDRLVPVSAKGSSVKINPQPVSLTGNSLLAEIFQNGETRVVEDRGEINSILAEHGETIAGVSLGRHGLLTLANDDETGIDAFDLRLIDILAQKAIAVLSRLEHETSLRASEERFRGLFEEAALGIALLAPNAQIVRANPELASMLGYEMETLQDRSLFDFVHPDDREEGRKLFEELMEGAHPHYELEQRYVHRDDTVFWGRATVSRHRGSGTTEVIATIEDVSNRKEYERQLKAAKQEAEEASRLKSALLANMSHEIRTPLTSIIGFTGVLEDNLSGENARYAELAHEGGKRLMETLESVLQLSKLEAGVSDPIAKRMDLVGAVRQTMDLYEPQAETAEITLQFDSNVDTLHGSWPPSAIQRILSNLLSNAIKFTPDGGQVTVRVQSTDETVVLEVEDTGIGISEDFRPRLFNAFTQESQGLKREHEGSGLGLAIVKRLVDLLEGRIEVESTKGEGTCFTLHFPLSSS